MANLPIEEIEKMVGSRYALTVLAGKRARELRDGAPRLVNTDSSNPIMVALQEIYEGKITASGLDQVEPEGAQSSPLEGVDLADLTDAEAAGVPLPGAADITGEPVGVSSPEVASDRLDVALEIGADAAADLEDTTELTTAEEEAPSEETGATTETEG